jgi:hypothetical protein
MQVTGLRKRFWVPLLVIVVGTLILATVMFGAGPTELTLSQFIEKAKWGEIDTILQSGDTIEGLSGDVTKYAATFIGDTNALHDYLEEEGVNLGPGGANIDVKPSGADWASIALTVILPVIAIIAIVLLVVLPRRKQATKPEAEERKTKEVESIEAIRELAELRDQGILTQEEFEQKKKKLL